MAFYGPYEGYIQKISEYIEHNYPKNIHFIFKQTEMICKQTKIFH